MKKIICLNCGTEKNIVNWRKDKFCGKSCSTTHMNKNKKDNTEDNLMLLCYECHKDMHKNIYLETF